ncbi:MAG: hypothetical protein FJY81_05085 [Candidatus Aminicenantes bacterium]|nr:hypothetical protein [Candidatus Aminicenantes bacterium]
MKKTTARLLLVALSAFPLAFASDWRSEVASFFTEQNDFQGAARYLEGRMASLSEEDKPVACGLLAFLFSRLADRENEYKRLGEYFEKYGPLDMGYHFLPPSTQNAVLLYLRNWMLRYPWVLKIGFVESSAPHARPADPSPPQRLVLGLEMAGEAYYKLFRGKDVLQGGQFKRGFNSLTLESGKLFAGSGPHPYILELKAGNLIVRRELVVDVRLNEFGVLESRAAEGKTSEYILKMFLGDNLLALSRKAAVAMPPMKVEIPPPTGVYDPWGPGYQNKPEIPNAFPILGIPALISELLKSLRKKDEVEPVPPVELKPDITFLFKSKNAEGRNVEILARLTLGLKDITFYPFSAGPDPT